jgi:uncharacterized protein YecE (DUF72 family)
LVVGTSGWQYEHWRERFYPRGLAPARWLEHYAGRFATVESNSAFYRLPESRTFADWAARTPGDFVFAVKASRYLTHVRRLADPVEPVGRLVERLEALGTKRGPVLLQLPPNLGVDVDALERTLAAFPSGWRVAVEPRHPSWFVDEVRRVLERRRAALCLVDRRGLQSPSWVTADWGYVRFHEGRASPSPCYGRQALATWAARLGELWSSHADVYCYFNNDSGGCAPVNAGELANAGHRLGLGTSRVGPPTAGAA